MAKKWLVLMVFLATGVTTAMAAPQNTVRPDRFKTMQECVDAVKSGNFEYYKPSYLTGHKDLAKGEEIVPLEERACVNLHIVGGNSFVPQSRGTQFVRKDGKITHRWDCGNDADQIFYIPAPVETGLTYTAPPATAPPAQETKGINPLSVLAIIDSFNSFETRDKVLDLEEKKSPYDDDKKGGNGKWWALGTAAVAGAVLCIWKCPRGGGGGSVNVTNINNSPTTTFTPPSAPSAPLGPIGIPTGVTNGPGATGNPGTGSGTSTTGPGGPSTLPPSTGS